MEKRKSWSSFEEEVRAMASFAYNAECKPDRIAGINIDGVVRLRPDHWILIEVTEERNLEKVRTDVITKLVAARQTLMPKGIYVQLINVLKREPTQGMKDIGNENKASVVAIDKLRKIFFDHIRYRTAREFSAFGSAVDPTTGEKDKTQFVSVQYFDETNQRDAGVPQIANLLLSGKNVVLIGEFGTGKSRCIEQLFSELAAQNNGPFFPISIDLRDCWGLKRAKEIIRRHMADLGLSDLENDAIKAFNAKSFIILLDGFDELGSRCSSR